MTPPSNPRIPRQFLILSGLLILFSAVFSILWFDPLHTVQATTSLVSHTLGGFASTCSPSCPSDPFTKPGTLVYGPRPSDTRWLPFPPQPVFAGPLQSADIQYDAPVPQGALELACPQYMKSLADSNGTAEMDWVRDKTLLFIGSSHDRCVPDGVSTAPVHISLQKQRRFFLQRSRRDLLFHRRTPRQATSPPCHSR